MKSPRLLFIVCAFFIMDLTYSRSIIEHVSYGDCDSLLVTATSEDPICYGLCNGTIQLMISGGDAPYTISWSNGSSQSAIGALCDGEYSVTVTDLMGCTAVLTEEIEVPDSIVINAEIVHATNGQSNGSLTASVTGGTEPYRYTLEQAATYQLSPIFTDLPAGMYAVSILDVNSCTGMSDSFEIQNLIGINELEKQFRTYPNPASSHLIVESDVPLSVQILDLHGTRLRSAQKSTAHHLPLEGISPGFYVLRISEGDNTAYRKFIVLEE